MVFVKIRETYDLHTIRNKMSVIGIHTPKPSIIKANFPGLLMQCKMWRPSSCDVKLACASTLPLDPQGVGTTEGDVAPEDLFNPILYTACSNLGMSQIEARINKLNDGTMTGIDVNGQSVVVDNDSVTDLADDFKVYYGLLANAHGFKHANPQTGLEMTNLRPLVYEMLYNIADGSLDGIPKAPSDSGANAVNINVQSFRGHAKEMPFINCTNYSSEYASSGFSEKVEGVEQLPANHENSVFAPQVMVGCIIVPPSRLHQLYYRMVVEWTIEFTSIRPLGEIVSWAGLSQIADITHYQTYDYSTSKQALTGDSATVMTSDKAMASANVDINKVM